jgi:hypothetical protein
MIKVTSKNGSPKRGHGFAIVRPDSVGCPTRMRSACVPSSSVLGSSGLPPHRPQTSRYAWPRVGWQLTGYVGSPCRRVGVERWMWRNLVVHRWCWCWRWLWCAVEGIVVAVATLLESCCLLPLQHLWTLPSVYLRFGGLHCPLVDDLLAPFLLQAPPCYNIACAASATKTLQGPTQLIIV